MFIRNWNCDSEHCVRSLGEVRIYPLDDGTGLILCFVCWDHQNQLRRRRRQQPVNWYAGEVHTWTPPEGRSSDALQKAA